MFVHVSSNDKQYVVRRVPFLQIGPHAIATQFEVDLAYVQTHLVCGSVPIDEQQVQVHYD